MNIGNNPTQLFYRSMLFVLLLRLALAALMPMTGDEAYFITWGKHLDYGYYDHTPIVGWLLGLFLWISDASWWLRMPAVLLPIFLAWGIYRITRLQNPEAAPWVALAFLFAPVNLLNVLITHDIPLIYFSFISAWFFYRAVSESQSYKHYLYCGLFLGLAFFSKYFAVLLGVAYGFYIVFFMRDKRSWTGLLIVFLMVLPFVFINLLWNYNHCWNNILFNLYNRTAMPDNIAQSILFYLVMLVYLLSPPLLYYVFRNRNTLKLKWQHKSGQVYIWIILFPLFLFLLLTLRKQIGLHWVLSFYPFAFIATAAILTTVQWRRVFYFMSGFGLIHLAVILAILILPPATFSKKQEALQNLTFAKHPHELLSKLAPYEKEYHLAAISYGFGSMLYYYSRKHIINIGGGSFHARQDDTITDFSKLDGQNILIVKRTKAHLDGFKKYFKATRRETIMVRDASFELLFGDVFDYKLYRTEVLQRINKDYYKKPDWLPVGQCGFQTRYNF